MGPLAQFKTVSLVDFEFKASSGERPEVECLVVHEVFSKRTIRLWEDDLLQLKAAPYSCGAESLFVAYFASAEMNCHLALGWPMPVNVLDLFTEFVAGWNGRQFPFGKSLLGALTTFNLPGIDAAEKQEMRDLAMRGGPWTDDERVALLDYCENDVKALRILLPAMISRIDLPRALLRGDYMKAVARMESTGIPLDAEMLSMLIQHWGEVQAQLIHRVDMDYWVFEGTSFRVDRWEQWLDQKGIVWPRLPSGALALDADTFKDMSELYPVVAPIHQLRATLARMHNMSLEVGRDGYNRTLLRPFATRSSRNAPSNSKCIFGPAAWLRSLIKPKEGYGVAYIDWSQQEIAVAAALSQDGAMCQAYSSGDPYLSFAKQAGLAPADATKASHSEIRELCKSTVLGIQYGMGAESLAAHLNQSPAQGHLLLRKHKQTYSTFWRWSDAAVDAAILRGKIDSEFGWPLFTHDESNPRTLRNYPMQCNGAEMLRIACILATEKGIEVCWPIHDAVLIQARLDVLEEHVAAMQDCMRQAGEIVLGGFQLRTEAEIVRYPDRYQDKRGVLMWEVVQDILGELATD